MLAVWLEAPPRELADRFAAGVRRPLLDVDVLGLLERQAQERSARFAELSSLPHQRRWALAGADRPGDPVRGPFPLTRIVPYVVQHLAVGQPRLRDVRSTAPAVTRSAALLRLLAQTEIDPPGLAELARLLDLPKSSVANLCAALEDVDLVRKVDGRYFLGRLVLELGGAYIGSVSYLQDFAESCRALRVASQETILLAQLDSRDILYLARHDGNQPVRLASDIGRRLPANCTSLGKAMLAQLEPETVVERFGKLFVVSGAHRALEAQRRGAARRPRGNARAWIRDR